MIIKLLLLFLGGGIGTLGRYGLATVLNAQATSTFPLGTLTVNVLGCLFIGLLDALLNQFHWGTEARLFLITGLLGGFTTFSTFGRETVFLAEQNHLWLAVVYIMLSVGLGLLAVVLGSQSGKWLLGS